LIKSSISSFHLYKPLVTLPNTNGNIRESRRRELRNRTHVYKVAGSNLPVDIGREVSSHAQTVSTERRWSQLLDFLTNWLKGNKKNQI